MSPAQTLPVIVNVGDWSEATRGHPVGKFCEEYLAYYDSNNHEVANEYYSPTKFQYRKSTGEVLTGGVKAYMQLSADDRANFTKWRHEPKYITVHESLVSAAGERLQCGGDAVSWEITGDANLYVNLVGTPELCAPAKVRDRRGEEWDVVVPASVHLWFERSETAKHMGLEIVRTDVAVDTFPIMLRLIRRRVVRPEDLGLVSKKGRECR